MCTMIPELPTGNNLSEHTVNSSHPEWQINLSVNLMRESPTTITYHLAFAVLLQVVILVVTTPCCKTVYILLQRANSRLTPQADYPLIRDPASYFLS